MCITNTRYGMDGFNRESSMAGHSFGANSGYVGGRGSGL